MITETIEMIKLTASEGMVLTNGDAYGKEVYLAQGGSPENWQEISDAEYEKMREEQEEER